MTQRRPLKEQLRDLEKLQELDLKINSLERRKDSLPVKLKTLTQNLSKIQALVTLKETQSTELSKTRNQTDAAIQLNEDRMNRAGSKLTDVQNTQEFQAATKEVDQIKKMNEDLAAQKAKVQAQAEAIAKELEELSAKRTAAQAEVDAIQSEISAQEGDIKKELDGLLSQRSQYTAGVDPTILSRYDRVRVAREGSGLAAVVGGRCKACNMVLRFQLVNELFNPKEAHSCPTCSRILFMPEPSPSSSGDVA